MSEHVCLKCCSIGGTDSVEACERIQQEMEASARRMLSMDALPQPNQPTVDLLHPEVHSTGDAIRQWWKNRRAQAQRSTT